MLNLSKRSLQDDTNGAKVLNTCVYIDTTWNTNKIPSVGEFSVLDYVSDIPWMRCTAKNVKNTGNVFLNIMMR